MSKLRFRVVETAFKKKAATVETPAQRPCEYFAKDVFNTNYQKVDIQSPGVQAFVDERHNKRVLGIAFAWRFQKGSETKESRRKKEIDETKRVNL